MGQSENHTKNQTEVSIKDIFIRVNQWLTYLLAQWKIILLVSVLGAGAGLLYSILKKPLYHATLSFALEDDKSTGGGLGAAMGLASQFGIDLGGGSSGGAFSGDNLLALMKSRSMVEKALLTSVVINNKEQTLADLYIDYNSLRDKWADKKNLANVKFTPKADRLKFSRQQDSVLGEFYKTIIKDNLFVDKIDKKLSIITVNVISKNELFAKFFTEVLVKTVSDFYVDTKTKKSVKNVSILQHQTDSVRRELNKAISGVAASADVNPNSNPALQILRVPSQKRQVDVQANQAILTQLVANLEISKVSLRKETPLVQVIDRPILPLERQRIGKVMGIIIGGFVSGLLTTLALLVKKIIYEIIA